MKWRGWVLGLLLASAPAGGAAWAQGVAFEEIRVGDPAAVYTLQLRDGSALVGRIVAVTADSVRIEMQIATLDVPRSAIVEVRSSRTAAGPEGTRWPENPAGTRLLVGPTALPLSKGEATFTDLYLFFLSGQMALTDRISIGAGFSVFPVENFTDNLFYVAPKITLLDTKPVKLAIGALAGYLGALEDESSGSDTSLGLLYGVATHGSREHNLSLGVAWGYQGDRLSDQPVFMLGAQTRVSRRTTLISENWLMDNDGDTELIFSYGIRILGERLAADIAFVNGSSSDVFPGLPFVGITAKR